MIDDVGDINQANKEINAAALSMNTPTKEGYGVQTAKI